jgi:RNA polymerase sigma-70 factor, ECF subfamily
VNADTDDLTITTTNPSGSDGRFEQDVLPLAGFLYRYALSYTKNPADAEDLVQETMLKAYKAFDRVRENTHFKAWTLTILKNTWIGNHRATKCRPAEHLIGDLADEQLAASGRSASEHMLSAEHYAIRKLHHSDVIDALHSLPEHMRQTVYYVAIEGMKYREAALAMGVSEGTVMSRMHRIRTNLRVSLGDVSDSAA